MPAHDFAAARANMVNSQVRPTDVTDYAIIDAMMEVPRERFVPADRRFAAYIDEDIEVASGEGARRYLMEPSPFAKLIQLADIGPNDTVLEIGCNTGYSTAVLARIASSIIAIESDAELAAFATEALNELAVDNAAVVEGKLEAGYAKEAPYDVIVIGGAVDEVPQAIIDQLAERGRLVAVVGRGLSAQARLFLREDGIVSSRTAFNAAVPPLPGFEKAASFVF